MPEIGYHASHEQFSPSELLRCVQQAEQAGFHGAMCSDHYLPWGEAQGHSGFAWSWLGSALQATRFSFGVVNAPGQRYHPAIIAQATATLAEMYPGRFWLSVGSGEWLNEHITGEPWPPKEERNARLKESVDVMRALWAGETVDHAGAIRVQAARLYSRPAQPPLLIAAALSPETAAWVAGWADGIITTSKPRAEQERFIAAFRRGGGEDKPMYVQAKISYARDEETARAGAYEQWRTNVLPADVTANFALPEQFDAAAQGVRPEDVARQVRISADIARHIAWIQEDIDLGFSRIYLHNVNCNQRTFIEDFGAQVLPRFAR
jgi:probable non-F420 flavinoid oxidoreductase